MLSPSSASSMRSPLSASYCSSCFTMISSLEERARASAELTFEHDRGAGLEQLWRIAVVLDRDVLAVEADGERDACRPVAADVVGDDALDADALSAELVPLRQCLVGVVEVQRGRR